ncbi:putative ribonuclease H-like domain-containing protein, partial [Tanacetum coccineum]
DGPKWLFDIDVLTKSMIYVSVVVGTNSNGSVDGSLFNYSSKNASNDKPQPSSDAGKKDEEGVSQESGTDDQERPENNTQDVNTAGPSINTASTNVNTGSLNLNTVSPTVTTAPLEATHADFFGDETELDMSNITTTYLVSSTPNTRIHKDHLHDHVIGDVQSGVQTRRMIKTSNEQGNKKDERGIVIRNKARQVALGYTQEEGIDYDEVFALVARIEAIRMFLAYASFKDFVVYQMDAKSAFLYGKTEEEVYVCQPPGFEDPEFPKRVYKVEKALYGLHQAPKACFGFSTMKTASTPMETSKPLLNDAEAEDVDVHLYRLMIGSLMYLTASRPDIIYLKGQPKLGLSYPKDSPFDLEAYTDSNYAGASLDMKSTIGVKNRVFHSKTKHIKIRHYFIRDSNEKKLIQMIKIHTDQNIADLLTKAFDVGRFQYLIAAEYAKMMLGIGVDDAIQVSTVGLTYYCTLDNEEMEITTTIDGKIKIVTEASIRRHLKLEDFDGISNLPTTKIFEQLALMGSKKTAWEQFSSNIATSIIFLATNRKFNFSKLIFDGMGPIFQGEGSTVPVESHHTPTCAPLTSKPHLSPILRSSIRSETNVPQPSSPPHTNVVDEAASICMDVRYGGAATIFTSLEAGQGSGNFDKTPTMPHDSPLPRVHIHGSDKGRMQHNELMDLVTKLSDRVGRKISQIDEEDGITLVQMGVSTASTNFTTANVPVTTAGVEISTANPEVKTVGDYVDDIAAESLVYIKRSAAKTKDKALRLQEQLDKEERQRIPRAHEAASFFNIEEWEDIQARIEADEELAQRLQAEEREKYSEAKKARLLTEPINQRKRHFAQQRAKERRNKPLIQAQQRTLF